jgi:alpha-L-rhamnosidase
MFSLPMGHPLQAVYQANKLTDSPWNQFIPEMGIHWGEWCVPESQEPPIGDPTMELIRPKQELTCAYTHYSMMLLEEMLRFIGKKEEADTCKKFAEGSKEAYHVHWVKEEQIETNHMAELVRPIALGLLTEQECENAAHALNEMVIKRNYKVGTGFLSTPFLLQVLTKYGYEDSAYRMLENTEAPGWLAMVAQGATTVWEDYECFNAEGSPLPHSFNHYSPGAVCAFLFDTVCGIQMEKENEIQIKPIPGGTLENATARVLTTYGEVTSSWEKKEGCITYTFEIPANVTAKVELPGGKTVELSAGCYQFME